MRRSILCLLPLLLILAACDLAGSQSIGPGESGKTPLVVFAAGSLIRPFADIEQAFERAYPDIDVLAEYHGSIQVMRHATELHEPIDVVATADASLIPMLMYAVENPDTNRPYADWFIEFASNHLALAYQPDSLYAGEIDAHNWYEILARPDVKVGIPDPRFDAAGYRALMAYALAQDYYGDQGIFTRMFSGNFTYPFGIFTEDQEDLIIVPEIVETLPGSHILIRGSSIQLIALLESGDIDYAFEYESVIRQHGLLLMNLPAALNLGEQEQQEGYANVTVNLEFQRFASVEPEFRGERIGYGITIPDGAPHPEQAARFIAFLLGPEGRAILAEDSHPLFEIPICDGFENIPDSLQAYCVPAE